jgi:hypothetical protein
LTQWSIPFDEDGRRYQSRTCTQCNIVEFREV